MRAMRGILLALPCTAAVVVAFGACATAEGDVKGARWRDFDAESPSPLVSPITEPTYEDAMPNTWTGIYRDFFGRRAKSTCAGNGTCHGAPEQLGTKTSNFLCVDLNGCYQSLRNAKDPDPRVSTAALVEQSDVANPVSAYLFRVLRFRNADSTLSAGRGMPQLPRDFAFQNADVVRMQEWIKSGAKQD